MLKSLLSSKVVIYFFLVLAIVFCGAGIFLNTLNNQPVWDDLDFINFPYVKSLDSIPTILMGAYPYEGKFRPLKMLLLSVNYSLWGENVFFYHLQAITIHILCSLLIFLILTKISKGLLISFLASLFFSLHPIHTEAISFITSSLDILGIAFLLTSFYFYINEKKFISLISFFLALFTNEIVLVLPLVLFSYEITLGKTPKRILYLINKLYLYASFAIGYFIFRSLFIGISLNKPNFSENGFITLLAMIKAFVHYVKNSIFPTKLNVVHEIDKNLKSIYYFDYQPSALNSLLQIDFLYLQAISILLVILYIFLKSNNRLAKFALLVFLIGLIPVSNIIPIGSLYYERYLYLPSLGSCLLLAILFTNITKFLAEINRKFSLAILLCFVAFISLYFTQSAINRNTEWRDSFSLWNSAVDHVPTSAIANNNLGYAYYKVGNYHQALKYFYLARRFSYYNNHTIEKNIRDTESKF